MCSPLFKAQFADLLLHLDSRDASAAQEVVRSILDTDASTDPDSVSVKASNSKRRSSRRQSNAARRVALAQNRALEI
jgi:hypothetical protein